MVGHIPPQTPFSTINNISISVKRSNFILVFLEAACHANPCAVRKRAGSSLYISRNIFPKFSNTSTNNNYRLEHINHDSHLNCLF